MQVVFVEFYLCSYDNESSDFSSYREASSLN